MSCERFRPAIAAHAGRRGARAGRGASPRRVRGVPAAARHPARGCWRSSTPSSDGACRSRRRRVSRPGSHAPRGRPARRRRSAGFPAPVWAGLAAAAAIVLAVWVRADSGRRQARQSDADAGRKPHRRLRRQRTPEAAGERRTSDGGARRLSPCAAERLRRPAAGTCDAAPHPRAARQPQAARSLRLTARRRPARDRRADAGAGDSAAARADDAGPPRRKDAAASSDAGGGTRRTDHCAARNCRNQGARRRDRQPPASRAAAAVNKEPCP